MATACSLPVMDSISTRALCRGRRGRLLEWMEVLERGDWALEDEADVVKLLRRRALYIFRSFMLVVGDSIGYVWRKGEASLLTSP